MNDAQRRITVLYGVYYNSDCEQVIYLIQSLVLVLHLLIYAEEMLDPAVNLGLDARLGYMLPYFINKSLNVLLTFILVDIDGIDQIHIRFRLYVHQRQVVKFDLDLADTKSLGYGRIDIESFP